MQGHADGRSRLAGNIRARVRRDLREVKSGLGLCNMQQHCRFGSTKSASNGKRRHPRPRTNMQARGGSMMEMACAISGWICMDLHHGDCAMLGKDTGSDTTCSDAEGSGPKKTWYKRKVVLSGM